MTVVAQWDVYVNPSLQRREEYPYLVDLQSDLLSALETRFVAPLARTRLVGKGFPKRLCPKVEVMGNALVLIAHEAGPFMFRLLKRPVASLRAEAHAITDALDAVISGI